MNISEFVLQSFSPHNLLVLASNVNLQKYKFFVLLRNANSGFLCCPLCLHHYIFGWMFFKNIKHYSGITVIFINV